MHLKNGFQGLAPVILLLLFSMGAEGNNVEGITNTPVALDHHHNMSEEPFLLNAFFTANDLKVGNMMHLYVGGSLFPSESTPSFLPKEKADLIPFSSSQLPFILDFFGFRQGSPQAKAVESTLMNCEKEATLGEILKFCPTSLESMLDYVHRALGTDQATPHITSLNLPAAKSVPSNVPYVQNYTIVDEPRYRAAPNMVGCHMLTYPYAVYYCHNIQGQNIAFELSLRGEDGAKVEAIGVCHMDMSHLNPNHVAYSFLGINPGDAPLCHVFPKEDLVWLP